MNEKANAILEIIDTTCRVHRIDMPRPEQETLAQMCWLNCGDDKDKIIDHLSKELRAKMRQMDKV